MTASHAIDIQAAFDAVWAVTEAVEAWPTWTPTVESITLLGDEPLHVGSQARIKQPVQPEALWTVTTLATGRIFAWETQRLGLWMRATHEIEAHEGGTINQLRVEMGGFLAYVLAPLLYPAMHWALAQENAGLKRFCEQVATRVP